MSETNILKSFIRISNIIGNDSSYVQGGGGNTSAKIDQSKMLIKASGFRLSDISSDEGYCHVYFQKIYQSIQDINMNEGSFTQMINSYTLEKKNRPSIETGFHTLLKKFVIHTHSVYTNILTCSLEGPDILKKIRPDSLWVSYHAPGLELTQAIQNELNNSKSTNIIIFLQNHGLIISSNSAKETLQLHEEVNAQIISYLNISPLDFQKCNTFRELSYIRGHVLFPDQVVYTSEGDSTLKIDAAKETIKAYNFIHDQILKQKLTPHFLNKDKIDQISNMESEKFRREMAGKDELY